MVKLLNLFLLLVFFSSTGFCEDLSVENYGKGPTHLRNQYELGALHLTGTPTSPEVLGVGTTEVGLGLAWTNTFAQDDPYRVDVERRETRFRFRRGIIEDIELAIEVPIIWRGGGVLDGLINWWHDLFSLPQARRDTVAKDQFQISDRNDFSPEFEFTDEGFGMGNVVLESKYSLTHGDDHWLPAAALIAGVSLPTANGTYGHQEVDVTVGANASKRFGEWIGYAGGSYFYYGDDEIRRVRYQQHHVELFGAVEYEFSKSTSALLSGIWSSETVSNLQQHPDYSAYLDAAVNVSIADETELEILLRQGLSPIEGSADVTFLFGLTHRLSD